MRTALALDGHDFSDEELTLLGRAIAHAAHLCVSLEEAEDFSSYAWTGRSPARAQA